MDKHYWAIRNRPLPLVNVFRASAGPTAYGNVRAVSPISAFKLFIDQPMLQTIRNHTVAHGKIDEPLYDVSVNKLYAFIGLQLAHGIVVGKNTSISDLWNKQWGLPIFSKTMAGDRFK